MGPTAGPRPLVSVVVLNYNGRHHLGYCLPSLAATAYDPFEVIVVDNASPDGSSDMVAPLSPGAEVIRNRHNSGWSEGNNVGVRRALARGAKYIVLANNDIRVDPRWIDVAVQVAEQDSLVGVIGFEVFETQPGVSDANEQFERACRNWQQPTLSHPKYVGGMAMFVRASLFEQLGVFDRGFWAFGEENDFQIRIRKAGYAVVAVNVPVWHHGSAGFGTIPRRAALLQVRGNIRLLVKHGTLRDLFQGALVHLRTRALGRRAPVELSAVERRLRGPSPAALVVLALGGTLWNLWMLPATLRRRVIDNRRASAVRQQRDRKGSA